MSEALWKRAAWKEIARRAGFDGIASDNKEWPWSMCWRCGMDLIEGVARYQTPVDWAFATHFYLDCRTKDLVVCDQCCAKLTIIAVGEVIWVDRK